MTKVVLITGTRKGIGRYLAEHYLEKGFWVAGCSRQSSNLSHEQYLHFQVDVSDEASVISMVRQVKRQRNSIDILINNAGVASMNHLFTTPFSSFEDIFKINMGGTFLLTREVGKIMASQKQGSIINFTSIAVPLNLEGESLYAASKAAVGNFTQTAASELGKFNIRINAIGPVPIETDLIRNVPKQKIQELIDRQIIKRLGNFEDVANVVDFFSSDKSSFITGQVIYLGGIHS